jgi:hypothetical protein
VSDTTGDEKGTNAGSIQITFLAIKRLNRYIENKLDTLDF